MNKANLTDHSFGANVSGVISAKLDAAVLVIEPDLSVWQKMAPTLSQYFGLVQHARTVELAVVCYRRFNFHLTIIDIKQVDTFAKVLASRHQPPYVAYSSEPDFIEPEFLEPKSIEPKSIEPAPIELEPIYPQNFMVLSRTFEAENLLAMMQVGARDWINKPVQTSQLERVLSRWALTQPNTLSNSDCFTSKQTSASLPNVELSLCIGDSKAAQDLKANLYHASLSRSHLLIEGQSGTGKKLAVRQLLLLSQTPSRRVNIDCRGELLHKLNNELICGNNEITFIVLGHLDEISIEGQIALMQWLDTIPLNQSKVRLVSLSCTSLLKRVQNGAFSSELYFKLAGLTIEIPLLHQRSEDIVLLVKLFANQLMTNSESCRVDLLNRYQSWRVTDFQSLTEYGWPGNIQQLKNAVEQCLLMDLLPNEYFKQSAQTDCQQTEAKASDGPNNANQHFFPIEWDVKQIEKAHILRVMKLYQGNRQLAAKHLNISRKTIDRKITEWTDEVMH